MSDNNLPLLGICSALHPSDEDDLCAPWIDRPAYSRIYGSSAPKQSVALNPAIHIGKNLQNFGYFL